VQQAWHTCLEHQRVLWYSLLAVLPLHFAAAMGAAPAVTVGVLAAVTLAVLARRRERAPLLRAIGLANRLAAGDLSQRVLAERNDLEGQLMRALNQVGVNLYAVVSDARAEVDAMLSASDEIAQGNEDLSARTENTASNLEQTAAAMHQLASSARNSADTVERCARNSNSVLGSVQSVVTGQFSLNDPSVNLNPGVSLETITRSTVSLASDGFFDKVKAGLLTVKRECEIVDMGPGTVTLSNGEILPADVVICGTGFHQRVPFFDDSVMDKITDERGNFTLYRQLLPVNVSNLAFNGYNSSFFSQLNCEMGALWLAANIMGDINLPDDDAMNEQIAARLVWMEKRTEGKHSKGTNIIPFSVHNIDELLGDLNVQLSSFTRFNQWLLPVNPKDYAKLTRKVIKRNERKIKEMAAV
jgi:hypothetical protein